MGNLLQSLRKLRGVDWLLKTVESYTSLRQQYIEYVQIPLVKSAIGGVLGVWTWFSESWFPMALMVAVGTYVILSYLPGAMSQRSDVSGPAGIQPVNARPDLHLLNITYAMICQTTILMMDDLLGRAPTGFPQIIPTSKESISQSAADMNGFVAIVRGGLEFGSDRRERYDLAMKLAEQSADQKMEETPIGERPIEIDPLLMRKWAIANAQYVKSIAFLQNEKAEAERNLINQRQKLLDGFRDMDRTIGQS